jgi:hypothetical protein
MVSPSDTKLRAVAGGYVLILTGPAARDASPTGWNADLEWPLPPELPAPGDAAPLLDSRLSGVGADDCRCDTSKREWLT